MKARIIVLFITFFCLWSIVIARGAYLQIFPNAKLQKLKEKQFHSVVQLRSKRGSIFDRNGKELALSINSYSLFADPKLISSPRKLARKMRRILKKPYSEIYRKIKNPKKRFVWIQRKLDKSVKEKIDQLGERGLAFIEEPKRIYPNGSLLSQVLGFVGSEDRGLEGLEVRFNRDLSGKKKTVKVLRDARGRPLFSEGYAFSELQDGSDIYLTIDREIQYFLEKELSAAVEKHRAHSAVGIVLEAQTSEVLAMANVPTFNPNRPFKSVPSLRKNRSVADGFEPGSTMKTFVIAAALREKLIAPNTKFYCENGKMKVGNRTVREADRRHSYGWLTVNEILANSSNIGSTKIAFELGGDSLRYALQDFGFGQKTQLEFSGEAKGILQSLPWNPHLLSNVSFGHGMTATPLQMSNAYAAIANGGLLKKPRLIRSIKPSAYDKEETHYSTEIVHRVLHKDEASQLTLMLTNATAMGTGQQAQVPGYPIAGKTGTSQKVNPNGRGYMKDGYISSFAGFIPANNPKYVIYILVDEPQEAYYGSQVAAPIFAKVANFAVRKARIPPIMISEKDLISKMAEKTPLSTEKKQTLTELFDDLSNKSLREALQKIKGYDLSAKVVGKGHRVSTVRWHSREDKKITIYLDKSR